MQPRALLVAALLVLLASARAQEPEEASLLGFMQDYVQQAQDALNSVKDLPMALPMAKQAGAWMEKGLCSLKGYWSNIIEYWSPDPGASPGTTPAPAV